MPFRQPPSSRPVPTPAAKGQGAPPAPFHSVSQCRPALGTYVKISIVGSATKAELLSHSIEAFEVIDHIEKTMSFHDRDSELSRVNRIASRQPVTVSRELAEVLDTALELSWLSAGLFDVTVAPRLIADGHLPDHGQPIDFDATWEDIRLRDGLVHFAKPLAIDLGGIAKGYAVDRALATIPSHLDVVINAGGDIGMRPWRGQSVAIRAPSQGRRGPALTEVAMRAPAVATSGPFERREQSPIVCAKCRNAIVVPHTVSMFAPSCMLADALTKVAAICPEANTIWQDLGGIALLTDQKGRSAWLGSD
ncbi:MAG: FAD:protein FMN transferase [Acidobacteriota bacterium]